MSKLTAIRDFFKSPFAKYTGTIILMLLAMYAIFRAGENKVQGEWDAANEKTRQEIAELQIAATEASNQVEIKYIDRVNTVVLKGKTITQYVDRYITVENDAQCIIPNNFVVIHDAAARNIVPETVGVKK